MKDRKEEGLLKVMKINQKKLFLNKSNKVYKKKMIIKMTLIRSKKKKNQLQKLNKKLL